MGRPATVVSGGIRRLPGMSPADTMTATVARIKARRVCGRAGRHPAGVVPVDSDKGFLALKAVMMPRDTNPHGTIFGGVTLSYIDQAGAVGARHAIRREGWPDLPLVTVAMNRVEFHEPVFVGDAVSFFTRVVRVGRTSITMQVLVEADRQGELVRLTEAAVTYVAVDLAAPGRPPVPIRGPAAPRAGG
ncbi:MAG: acyl-CoA thioesterase [Thermoguttaceae bacterium]